MDINIYFCDIQTGIRGGVSSSFYKHGVEEEAILKHDEQGTYVTFRKVT